MKESDANELKRLKEENAQLQARLERAHKNHDRLLGGHLLALRALQQIPAARGRVSEKDAYNGVVECILAQPGVNPDNISGTATLSDLGVAAAKVGACVNAKFDLEPPISTREMTQDTTIGAIAELVVERS
jgi:hypothetical protein